MNIHNNNENDTNIHQDINNNNNNTNYTLSQLSSKLPPLHETLHLHYNYNSPNPLSSPDDLSSRTKTIQSNPSTHLYTFNPNSNDHNIDNPITTVNSPEFERETKRKLKEIDVSISHLNAKNESLLNYIESMKHNNTNTNNIQNTPSYLLTEIQRLKTSTTSLLNDNIMYQSDISHLSKQTHRLELELHNQRQRNYELATQNQHLLNQNSTFTHELAKTKQLLSEINHKHQLQSSLDNNNNHSLSQLKQSENELQSMRNNYYNLQLHFDLLQSDYDKMHLHANKNEDELNAMSHLQSEYIERIESKMNIMSQEVQTLRKENVCLKEEVKNIKNEWNEMKQGRDECKDKYYEEQCKSELLEGKMKQIMKEFKKYKEEIEERDKRREIEDKNKKERMEVKKRLVEELQRKIGCYKEMRLKNIHGRNGFGE